MSQRTVNRSVLLGLVGLLCLLTVSLGSVLWVYGNLQDFRSNAYMRCMDRVALDAASANAREVQAREWNELADEEMGNPFIDDKLRASRVESYRQMAAAAQDAANTKVRGSCAGYRP